MELGTEPAGSSSKQKRPRSSTRSRLTIDEERIVTVAAPPRGSRFKGYTSFVVQDLVIRRHVVNFRCERWQMPDARAAASRVMRTHARKDQMPPSGRSLAGQNEATPIQRMGKRTLLISQWRLS